MFRRKAKGSSKSAKLESLFYSLETPLLSYAQRLNLDESSAQDVVQESFKKLFISFETVAQPKAWLFRTVHNLAMNHHRKHNRVVSFEASEDASGEMASSDTVSPDEYVERMDTIGVAREVLNKIGGKEEKVLRLKFIEDISYKKISEQTGLSESNVGYVLHHALKLFGLEMEKRGIGL